MTYGTNGIKAQWKRRYGTNGICPMVHSPNGKDMVLRKILYRSVMVKYKNVVVKD